MRIIVMKFGGTSVADPEKIQRAASRAVLLKKSGYAVAAVVSAPGDMTDELLALSSRVAKTPNARELDQLITTGEIVGVSLFAMACITQGVPAISLNADQAGIKAHGPFGHADILRVRPDRILSELKKGRIAVIAGFQGLDKNGDVLSLGRGGSDLTAVAIAAAVKSVSCEIFTDVKGIYTADPRIVPEARELKEISLLDMIELAKSGSQVMQSRSLEIALKRGVSIHVRSAFHSRKGTMIVGNRDLKSTHPVSALSLERGGRVSAIGDGIGNNSRTQETILQALEKRKIKILSLSLSPRRISVVVKRLAGETALRVLHKALLSPSI